MRCFQLFVLKLSHTYIEIFNLNYLLGSSNIYDLVNILDRTKLGVKIGPKYEMVKKSNNIVNVFEIQFKAANLFRLIKKILLFKKKLIKNGTNLFKVYSVLSLQKFIKIIS